MFFHQMVQQLGPVHNLPEHPLRVVLNLLPVDQQIAVTVDELLAIYNAPQGGRNPIQRRPLANLLGELCRRGFAGRAVRNRGAGGRRPNVYWARAGAHAPEMMGTSIALRLVIAKAALDAVLGDAYPLDQVQEDEAEKAIAVSNDLQYLREAIRLLPSVVEPNTGNARSVVIEAIKTYCQARLTLGQKDVVLSVRGLVAASSGLFVVGHVGAAYGGPEVRVINLDQVEDAKVTKDRSSGAGNFSLDEYIDANRNLFG